MNKLIIFSIFIVLKLSLVYTIDWQDGNWAFGCDFTNEENNMGNVQGPGEECGSTCSSSEGCTHFVHASQHNGGTCYMKKGSVTKEDAVDNGDRSFVCGIVKEGSSDGSVKTTKAPSPSESPSNVKFPGCTMKWGTDYVGPNKDYKPWDYATKWIGYKNGDHCKGKKECTDFNDGDEGAFYRKMKELGKIPVVYGYIIAFEARNLWNLHDCNDPKYPNVWDQLCGRAAKFIRENRQYIVDRYKMHATKQAQILGKNATVVYLMEPDLFQYHDDKRQSGGGITGEYAAALYEDICKGIKEQLPNVIISWDISPWGDMNRWWGYFKNSKYVDLINTSGGGHLANNPKIDPHNPVTYDFMRKLTGRRIISDCGYGVVGIDEGERENKFWYNEGDVKARIRDGVAAHTLANTKNKPPPSFRPNTC